MAWTTPGRVAFEDWRAVAATADGGLATRRCGRRDDESCGGQQTNAGLAETHPYWRAHTFAFAAKTSRTYVTRFLPNSLPTTISAILLFTLFATRTCLCCC